MGQKDLARAILEQVESRRIDKHIEPSGAQQHELARTKSLGYSRMNLDGLFRLAAMAEKLGIDLWSCESPDGRSLRKALDFLAPYADPENKWTYKQISDYSPTELFSLLRRGSIAYEDPKYETLIAKIPAKDLQTNRTNLLWPLQKHPSRKSREND